MINPYVTAIREQIAYLQAELERIEAEQEQEDRNYMRPALADPGFRQWLLKQQLQVAGGAR